MKLTQQTTSYKRYLLAKEFSFQEDVFAVIIFVQMLQFKKIIIFQNNVSRVVHCLFNQCLGYLMKNYKSTSQTSLNILVFIILMVQGRLFLNFYKFLRIGLYQGEIWSMLDLSVIFLSPLNAFVELTDARVWTTDVYERV